MIREIIKDLQAHTTGGDGGDDDGGLVTTQTHVTECVVMRNRCD